MTNIPPAASSLELAEFAFSTVGYGEIVPHTTMARVLAICDSILGVTVMGIIAGLVLSLVTPWRLP